MNLIFFIYWQQSMCMIYVCAHFCLWVVPKEQTTVAFVLKNGKAIYISKSILALSHLIGMLQN